MRIPSRFGPTLLGLATSAVLAPIAMGQQFNPGSQAAPIVLEQNVAETAPAKATAKHTHKGLFGSRSCTECQRARAKARHGVDVPPPPSAMSADAGHHGHDHGQGQGHDHAHAHIQAPTALGAIDCPSCEADAAAMGGTIVPGSMVVSDGHPPGRAVVGGEAVAAEFPVGRAVAGPGAGAAAASLSEPAPIGAARASQGNFTPIAATAPSGAPSGLRDPSVVPSSMIPPAQTPMGAPDRRPRILKHLLDLPDLDRIGRNARDRKARSERETHAAISYGADAGPITELPASAVFGPGK